MKHWCILLSFVYISAQAQTELQQEVNYTGGTTLKISSFGFNFTIPQGWQGGVPAGSASLILVDALNEATIIISSTQTKASDMRAELQKQIDLGGGISISPIGLVNNSSDSWTGNYHVIGAKQEMKAFVHAKIGNYQNGIICIALTLPTAIDRAKSGVEQVMQTVQFYQPKQNATGVTKPWSEYFSNKSLKRYYTQGDYSESDFIYLCANGSFTRKTRSSSGGITGIGSINNSYYGRWQATGQGTGVLTLMDQDGTRTEFQIQYGAGAKGTGVYLNGTRYYEEATSDCN
jgi:hypothetical protein